MELKDFTQLWEQVKTVRAAAVPGAADEHTLEAIFTAQKKGVAYPVLIGEEAAIKSKIEALGFGGEPYEIIAAQPGVESAQKAVEAVNSGAAEMILKGNMQTADLLKAVVAKDNNFRTSAKISHFGLVGLPGYHKLLVQTDAAMVLHPTLEDKKAIVENAVQTLRGMGYEQPKVAVLCAVETLNPKMQETIDAAALKEMAFRGELKDCVVEGPISYDLAFSKESAEIKGYDCPYCGDFDIFLMPDMVTGNILSKAWSLGMNAVLSGMIVGAKAPIALGSRAATVEDKLLSMVLCNASLNHR